MAAEDLQAEKSPATREQLAQSLVGRFIGGDFEIRREIGRGGMGTVFEGWQRSLQRVVAVKVLAAPIGLTDTAVQRFQREAQAAAKLHHTNIVPIYAQGEQEGVYYYAMELVRGRSVHDIIVEARGSQDAPGQGQTATLVMAGSGSTNGADGSAAGSTSRVPRPPSATTGRTSVRAAAASQATVDHFDTIARLTATVAEALEYAHQAGVIHRDIKPHNLILGDDGRLCITDFGLARVAEQPGMTMTGEFIGSPLYMSPEQVTGGAGRVDRRTDIYSLGATLYEWMTLLPPFPGQTRELVISQIMMAEPQQPRSLNPKVPLDLETICLKAIDKHPNKRYQSAGEMAADLRRYLERSTIKARRAGLIKQGLKRVQRHPVAALVAVLVLVVLLFGGAWLKQQGRSREADADRQDAVARAARARQETEQLAEDHDGLMTSVEGLTKLGAAEQQEQNLAFSAASEVLGDLGAAVGISLPGGRGSPNDALAEQLGDFGQQVPRRFASDLRSAHLQAERQRRESADPQGELAPAEAQYLQALTATEDAVGLELLDEALSIDKDLFDARYLRAVILCRLARFEQMIPDAEQLLQMPQRSPSVLLLRAIARLFLGQPDAALQDVEQCLNTGGDTAWSHVLAGLCHARRGDVVPAIREYSIALQLAPDHVVARFARSKAQYYLGAYDAALLDVDKVVELIPQSPDSVEAYILRGECHDKLLQFDAAIKDYNEAIRLGNTSLSTAAKLVYAMANAKKQELRKSTLARTAEAESPEAGESGKEQYRRPLRDLDDANWLRKWIEERMGGQKPPPGTDPDLTGYPFGRPPPQ